MASRRHKRRNRICRGKKDYGDEHEHAKWDARNLSIRDKKQVDVFRCPTCDGVHVGHAPKDHVGNVTLFSFDRGVEK